MYTTDAEGRLTHFNPACVELSGRALTLGSDHSCVTSKLSYPDGRPMPQDECPMAIALKDGRIIRGAEVIAERSDGTRIWVASYPTVLRDPTGKIVGGIDMLVDITERRRAEEASSRLAAIVTSSGDAIISKDLNGIITSWNQGAQRLFGYTAAEVIGKSVSLLIPEDHRDEEPKILSRIRQGESVEHYETVRRRKDGSLLDISLTVSPIKNSVGQIIGASKVARDITERKQAEQALRESEQRFRQAADEAEAANRAKDMFLATLSHEMRTPLSAIVGWMQILQGGTEGGCRDAELNEGLEVIERNARTMVQLLDDVMDVSRIVSGKVRLEVRPCELSEVIRAGIDVVRSAARARDIALTAELDPAASAASCDAARMQQVVWNLLSNAIKFTPKGGKVHVTLAREGADVRIQVSDSGQGIDPELLPYVFDRFRQADSSTRRRFGGLGLGLSIVKHLVELHGGTVQAQSEGEGRGSTFTVLLPIRAVRTDESGDDPEADESEQRSTAGLPLVRLDALRVLVVDDEPDARRLLVKVLREAGAVVTAAASAAEAIEALQKSNPEVLVSDLGMPDEDGFDLIRQIRAHGHHAKDLPAVALDGIRPQERPAPSAAGRFSDARPQAGRSTRPDGSHRQPRRSHRSRRVISEFGRVGAMRRR